MAHKGHAANKKRELQIKEHIMRVYAAEGTGQDGEMLAFPTNFAVRHDVLFGLWFTITHCSEVLS